MKSIALLLVSTLTFAQAPTPATDEPPHLALMLHRPGAAFQQKAEDKSDPGYALYKKGYALILGEQWKEARKTFEGLLARYPRSSYSDDARYWTAYSYKETDRNKALDLYRKFIDEYPKSSYYDDAVADFNSLQGNNGFPTIAPGVGVASFPAMTPRPSAVLPPMRNLQRDLRRELRQLHRMGLEHATPRAVFEMPPEENLDKATRLKMDALYALGETKEDDKSFTTLKNIAIDMHQPRPLREAAMDALSNFTRHDVLSVFVEVARNDTNSDIQGFAVDFIGENGGDKNHRVAVLEDLYRTLPKERRDQRATIVYTIANVGNDRAVEFLKRLALSDDDYDIRRDAVYYLGNIGGEQARSALYEILQGK
jgi:tetratricopeptide (TPR) repeat protein